MNNINLRLTRTDRAFEQRHQELTELIVGLFYELWYNFKEVGRGIVRD